MDDRTLQTVLEDEDDIYLYAMMHLMTIYDSKQLEQEKAANPSISLSKEKFVDLIEQINERNRKNEIRRMLKKGYSVLQKAAVFLIAFILAGAFAVVEVDALREPLANWLMNWRGKDVIINFDQQPKNNFSDLSFSFGWLPEGTYLIKQELLASQTFDMYQKDILVGYIIIMPLDVTVEHDTENVHMEHLQVDGYEDVMYFEKTYQKGDVAKGAIATNANCAVTVESYTDPQNILSRDEVIKILENINFYP